jgi:Flp pilus assembly protein TadD
MSSSPTTFANAVVHHQAGRFSDAERLYREILETSPDDPSALNNLGLIVAAGEAVELFRRAVVLRPDYADASINLANRLYADGRLDEALPWYERAIALNPNRPDLHFCLGSILVALGRSEDAVLPFERAIALRPNFTEAMCNLATIHALANRPGPAAKWYRWALAIDPTVQVANTNMISILEGDGRLAEAAIYRTRVARPAALAIEAAPEQRRTVLVLSSLGTGNIPIDFLFPRRTTTRIKWYVDCATDEQEQGLPPYDLAFNAVGNADVLDPSFERASRFHERWPVLNPPATVARTRRDRMPELLAGIPGVVVPPVLKLRRDEVIKTDIAAKLAAYGMTCPVLVRPIATQGGHGMILIESPDKFGEFTPDDADGFYFIGFHDYKLQDGHYRKYRMIFVDRKIYPYHLAISKNWLVHYFSADMLSEPWKREEEKRFLDDPPAALGAKAYEALEAIAWRMDMDYAGIDFSLLPDGRVLVFEANATMAVHLHDPIAQFPYKHVHVPKIFEAFEAMLVRRETAAKAK